MLLVWIRGKGVSEQLMHARGPLEFGRGPQQGNIPRAVLQDPTVSTNQCRLTEGDDGSVLIENLSAKVAITLADGSRLDPGASGHYRPPLRLHVGDRIIEIAGEAGAESEPVQSLRSIAAPVDARDWARSDHATLLSGNPGTVELTSWFEALISVQKAAASSPDFFTEVARAVVELIGLDRGLVLLHTGEKWIPVAIHDRTGKYDESDFSHAILERVYHERLTFFQQDMPTSSSLVGVSAVVAAPILNQEQRVVGAIYGVRDGRETATQIRSIEAQLTQVLAATVSAGLTRLDVEANAARNRVQFEQFFTSDLAAELDRDPTLLDGRERAITALFADIRGFSSVSEKVSARTACDLIRDIMEELTAAVRGHGGVVVDYQGDGLLAMWNAPVEQPDHAQRACRAALEMQERMPELNLKWQERLGRVLGVGVGINTGQALVGNTGSRLKFKYGPLGHTVNLASRVEGATKQFGVGVLITGRTRDALEGGFATRRLCKVRVVGIEGVVELYELGGETAEPGWARRRDMYEQALAHYEAREWGEACHALVPLLPARHDAAGAAFDTATVALLGRALECVKTQPKEFDGIVELSSK